ncbi:hypothetical protein JCGZ_10528 [Jatropha curcas]|uniref:Uncharacterized protein n=1 Tax=Jatropha curcas TaxID=180498 RepID=A0A067KHS9_JATCU|nr:hypothetical protein JCGZ_10528 [Jatropha curcas]
MASKALVLAMLLIGLLAPAEPKRILDEDIPDDFSRCYFPPGFTFGTATSAYQIEGSANKFGRGPSGWDEFSGDFPGLLAPAEPKRILDEDIPDDFSRCYFPPGFTFGTATSAYQIEGSANKFGRGPSGWDEFSGDFPVPPDFVQKFPPFIFNLGSAIACRKDFRDYADLCFQRFGDRGLHAPGRCSSWVNHACRAGNSATEPDIVAHHLVLSHAEAFHLYREKYQTPQDGKIRLAHVTFWYEPFSNCKDVKEAALDFNKYDNQVIYITENGIDEHNNETHRLEEAVQDPWRTQFYQTHLWNVLGSIRDYNVNVKGYFACSYLDNYEWDIGYTSRFGLFYVDYKNNLARHPKQSAEWFQKFLKNELSIDNIPSRQCHSGFIEAAQQNSFNGCQ